jgi:uncharacterized surface protein with fasciclin (FAS1) repeats
MSLKSMLAAGLVCAAVAAGCTKDEGMNSSMNGSDMKKSDTSMSDAKSRMAMAKMDIIETAVGPNMQEVTTLVKAIQAADLVQPLKGKGPFTVFAPTNAAFAKLPPGALDDLLKPENKEKLRSVLLYHVHQGAAVPAADVRTMSLSTMNGKPLMVKADGGNVMVNDAKVIKTDVVASNGIIHWIDTVVMP